MRAKSETAARRNRSFEEARRSAVVRLAKGLDLRWTPARLRDELHERVSESATTKVRRVLES